MHKAVSPEIFFAVCFVEMTPSSQKTKGGSTRVVGGGGLVI
tara:strand:+ start:1408 stop:1530 length:123 start_codon:yes stop_codon:yes gene_type:complete